MDRKQRPELGAVADRSIADNRVVVGLGIEKLPLGVLAQWLSSQAFIQQRVSHGYRWQRPTPLPSLTTQSRDRSQLGVDSLDVAHAGLGDLASTEREIFTSHCICLPGNYGVKHRSH